MRYHTSRYFLATTWSKIDQKSYDFVKLILESLCWGEWLTWRLRLITERNVYNFTAEGSEGILPKNFRPLKDFCAEFVFVVDFSDDAMTACDLIFSMSSSVNRYIC